jgi:hypothetical protein
VLKSGIQRNILELPVTVGFNRTNFDKASRLHDFSQHRALQLFKPTALLWHSKVLRKIYFSPEVADIPNMITLADKAIENGQHVLHMYFHSSNLISDGTGFLKSDNPYALICKRITAVIEYLQSKYEVIFMTPSEYKVYLQSNEDQIAK